MDNVKHGEDKLADHGHRVVMRTGRPQTPVVAVTLRKRATGEVRISMLSSSAAHLSRMERSSGER